MKHLKKFKLFENHSEVTDEIWNDISDILIELEHEGFIVSRDLHDFKKVSNKLCEDVIEIIVNKRTTEYFNYEEIKDTFMRLIDYLEPYGWNYSILYFGDFHFIEFECGGKDPLAKVYNPYTIPSVELLNKSELEKTLTDCQAFKICFYQSIDHLIN